MKNHYFSPYQLDIFQDDVAPHQSMTAYLIMIGRYFDTNATDVEKNYDDYGNLKMKRSALNQYLKVSFNKFDNSLIEDIYDKECDSYQLKYLK